jgi:DNA-binding HxlR family transcriptional regulator
MIARNPAVAEFGTKRLYSQAGLPLWRGSVFTFLLLTTVDGPIKRFGQRREGSTPKQVRPREYNMSHKSAEYCRSCTETIHQLQGKWKMQILCEMREAPVRLGQLARALPAVSKKVLTENLRELERAGLIVRQEYQDALRHVEYDFRANVREELCGLLDHLASFGNVLREPLPSPSGESSSVQLNGTHVAVRDQLPKRQRSLA